MRYSRNMDQEKYVFFDYEPGAYNLIYICVEFSQLDFRNVYCIKYKRWPHVCLMILLSSALLPNTFPSKSEGTFILEIDNMWINTVNKLSLAGGQG